jgi:uncharacterized protein (DUF2252 family)
MARITPIGGLRVDLTRRECYGLVTADTTESAPAKPVAHPSVDERAARGKVVRESVPRSAHAELADADRDPVAILEEQGKSRVPDLLPIRYARMAASPFAFLRGAAAIMARDLADGPRTTLNTQLCGDAHLSNFGGFASPERTFVFDLNDFDETLPGPFEWDLKRLVASIEVAGRGRDFKRDVRRSAMLAAASGYREAMREFAGRPNLAVWYARLDAGILGERLRNEGVRAALRTFERTVAKARTKNSIRAFTKLTETVDGELRISSQPPLLVPIRELTDIDGEELMSRLNEVLRNFRRTLQGDRRALLEQFRLVDVARKVVGVGSVGTRAWVALLIGRDEGDPLFLQVKEAQQSVLEPYLGRSRHANHGRRVVGGQRLMQSASDIFLGWNRTNGIDGLERDFYMRQLWDWKASLEIETVKPAGFVIYAGICGETLARSHARSGDRVAIASYLGKSDAFDRALAEFAVAYADRTERDHAALVAAIESGRLTAAEAA